MGTFVVYSLKVALCIVMFYVYYKLLLSRTTLHTFNRFMILALVVMSLFLPLMHITLTEPAFEGVVTIDSLMLTAKVIVDGQQDPGLSLIGLLPLVYLLGVAAFTIRMMRSYLGLHRIMKSASRVVDDDGVRIYVVDGDVAPFSWLRNIVISADDYLNNREAIIRHEKAHAAKCHSADILLCNILTVVQWFNPAAWLLKSELQNVHEYEADEAVLNSGISAVDYQLLLVRKAVGDHLFAIANNLTKYSLKKRITMMKTKRTNRWACTKALVVLPLSAVLVTAFATQTMADVENNVVDESQQLVQTVSRQMTSNPPKKSTVMSMRASMPETAPADTVQVKKADDKGVVLPEFPGGEFKLMEFMRDNVTYPKEAAAKEIQGSVLVSFVVTAEGNIINAHVAKSVHPLLDAEALRVINSMPRWTPGKDKTGKNVNVEFKLPVTFRLS